MTVAAGAAAATGASAASWLWALLGRANTADACILALLLVFFWVDVAKVCMLVEMRDGILWVYIGKRGGTSIRHAHRWAIKPL